MLHGSASTPSRQLRSRRWRAHPTAQVAMAEMTPAPGCNGTTMRTITPGSGKEITKGSTATVHATGVVKERQVQRTRNVPARVLARRAHVDNRAVAREEGVKREARRRVAELLRQRRQCRIYR